MRSVDGDTGGEKYHYISIFKERVRDCNGSVKRGDAMVKDNDYDNSGYCMTHIKTRQW